MPNDKTFVTLGTDGFGRSDSREKLREFFEVNRYFVVIASLYALMKEGKVEAKQLKVAMKKFGIYSDKLDPLYH